MNESFMIAQQSRRSRSSRVWIWVASFLSVLAVIVICGYFAIALRAERALRGAIVLTEQISPGWRLEQIEAARATPRRNSAYRVLDAADLLPAGWQSPSGASAEIEKRLHGAIAPHAPGQCFDADFVRSARKIVDSVMPAVAEARALADQPDGRYTIVWNGDVYSTVLPHLPKVRDVSNLLTYDALLFLQDADPVQALNSCRAVLNAGRSIGDEPLMISQLARLGVVENACRLVEHVLVHGETSDATLAEIGRELNREEAEPRLWWALRGERAAFDQLCQSVQEGEVTAKQLHEITNQSGAPATGLVGLFVVPGAAANARAGMLRYLSTVVQIAEMAPTQQIDALARLDDAVKHAPGDARLFAISFKDAFVKAQHGRARLRCAAAGIAAERFRLANGDWPALLDQLVPALLERVPTSPIDGKPLRMNRSNNGISIDLVDQNDQRFADVVFRVRDARLRDGPTHIDN
jgi:hypothetical protein